MFFHAVLVVIADRNFMNRNFLGIAQCLPGKNKYLIDCGYFVTAPSAQRTLEDSEAEQSVVDGNFSSDDPLKLCTKR